MTSRGRRFFVLFFRINFFVIRAKIIFCAPPTQMLACFEASTRNIHANSRNRIFLLVVGKLTAVTFLFFIITVGTFLQYQHTRICSPSYLFKFKFTSACSLTVLQPSITIPTPEVLLLSF